MPEYNYICTNGHIVEIREGMFSDVERICHQCGEPMWRKPNQVGVNWGGLHPSQGELNPELQDMVDRQDERRDDYLQKKEAYDDERKKMGMS